MENVRPPRRQLHGYVSDEARDGWYAFAEQHGTNVTALLEAAGLVLSKHAGQPRRQHPQWLRQLLAEAQVIASARSSRQRRD